MRNIRRQALTDLSKDGIVLISIAERGRFLMAKNSTKIRTSSTHTWMQRIIGALMLATLTIGQPVLAEAAPIETPVEAIVAPEPEPVAAPAVTLTVQDVLLSVCQEYGYDEACAKTLLGMLWNESTNVSTAIGDGGKARGYFQIWVKLHKISVACAEDLVCSAEWSLNYLEAHQYPKYPKYAIQCHNSCGAKNGYAAKAIRNGKRLWDQPLEIDQEAPIELVTNQE